MTGIDGKSHFYKWLGRIYPLNRKNLDADNGIEDLKAFARGKLAELVSVSSPRAYAFA